MPRVRRLRQERLVRLATTRLRVRDKHRSSCAAYVHARRRLRLQLLSPRTHRDARQSRRGKTEHQHQRDAPETVLPHKRNNGSSERHDHHEASDAASQTSSAEHVPRRQRRHYQAHAHDE